MNPGTIILERLTLERDLLNGLKISELGSWSADSEVRQILLQNLVFGEIRWPKSNGKPLSATLNQGFTILHSIQIINGNTAECTNSFAALPEPFKFDEPDDADHYGVGFVGLVPNPYRQHIQPTFSSSVAWPRVLDGYRLIKPSDWQGYSQIDDWAVVPDFTVSLQLW
jgi:hypothetical protein